MTQLDLLTPPSTMDQRFWTFHRRNPHVYRRLVQLTEQAKLTGRQRIGMKMLFEVIRWHELLETQDDEFKLNNSFTSRYVRLIEEKRPDLAIMFQTRRIRS